jgi:hypothetical protein
MALGNKRKWLYYKHLYCVLGFPCKVDFQNDKFVYTSKYTYNKVMQLLELAGVVEQV